MNRNFYLIMSFIFLLAAITAGCNLPSKSVKTEGDVQQTSSSESMENLVQTAQASVLLTSDANSTAANDNESEELMISRDPVIEAPTEIPTETPDPNRKPPELPAVFQTSLLNPLDTPHEYEDDICKVIKNRWGEGKAAPGTVVMVVMYHGIAKGATEVQQDNAVTQDKHQQFMRNLHDQGFTAINTEQFIAFMENNDWIPERSALIIVDDRHSEENYTTHFKDYYDDWGWPVVNAWISAEGTSQTLWDENAHAEEIGLVDHQAHGVVHNTPMSDASTDEYLIGELKGSVDAIQEHFHKTPHAIIWPGGGFGKRPIEIAKQYGYKVDGNQDPLFVIPRYWSPDASEHVDTVRQLGKQAKEYYESIRGTELEYYDIVCKPIMGEL